MNKLYWAKVKPDAKIPQKRYEDAGYDLYPCFEEDYMVIEPHETKLVPLGVASAFDDSKRAWFNRNKGDCTKKWRD